MRVWYATPKISSSRMRERVWVTYSSRRGIMSKKLRSLRRTLRSLKVRSRWSNKGCLIRALWYWRASDWSKELCLLLRENLKRPSKARLMLPLTPLLRKDKLIKHDAFSKLQALLTIWTFNASPTMVSCPSCQSITTTSLKSIKYGNRLALATLYFPAWPSPLTTQWMSHRY